MCQHGNEVLVEIPDNIEILYNTPDQERRQNVMIDACLVDEIKDLWIKGIHTQGCCCGHNNQYAAWIGVVTGDAGRMKDLGYVNYLNPNYPNDDCFFIPRAHPIKGESK